LFPVLYCKYENKVKRMINFVLLVNKRGQPRIRKYYNSSVHEVQFEPELIKRCVLRDERLVT
jgi:hypothetical protein